MYIPDLQNVSNSGNHIVLAIGWLDRDASNQKFDASRAGLAERATELVNFTISRDFAVARTRGIHRCNLCEDRDSGSNSCILIPSSYKNKFYITNFLLPHYISKHKYSPPDEFSEAIFSDFSSWEGPNKDIEKSLSLTSPEGMEIERTRLKELIKKHPDMRDLLED